MKHSLETLGELAIVSDGIVCLFKVMQLPTPQKRNIIQRGW